MKVTDKKTLTLKTLTKSNVWDLQENDIFRIWEYAEKEPDLKDNARHYIDIIRSAFNLEEIKIDRPEVVNKYKDRGFKIGQVKLDDNTKQKWALAKKPILRVTDLTYENIRHITATKLLEVIDRNFGGGWESLSQSVQDIIESGFDISTTTLPKDRLKKPGGMYDKKVADGFEVLEIAKGTWVEAIFAKLKPEEIKLRMQLRNGEDDDFDEDDDSDVIVEDNYSSHDEEDEEVDGPNDEDITEDNYSTMMDLGDDSDEESSELIDFSEE